MVLDANPPTHYDPIGQVAVKETSATGCCIVGGGPAGAVLALLLARQNIPVTLLEAHQDFDREFRGDTIHPSVLEIRNQIGLAGRLLQLPHSRVSRFSLQSAECIITLGDLSRLPTKFPYIMLLPQVRFLEFIVAEAKRYPAFRLVMGANVQDLLNDGGVFRGVRYRATDGWYEVRAPLTVAADGRFSQVRHLAGLEPAATAPPMDVLWFRLSCRKDDAPAGSAGLRLGPGSFLVLLDRDAYWQIGYAIPKGSYHTIHGAGLEHFRTSLAGLVPELADRVNELQDWRQLSLLSVESSRLKQWHLPGLLLIGDAAHVMSPVGGIGINYAIQDAVVAANRLTGALRTGRVTEQDLAEVQREREFPTKVAQAGQSFIQRQIISTAFSADRPVALPWRARLLIRIPFVRRLASRLLAFGIRRVRLADELVAARAPEPAEEHTGAPPVQSREPEA